MQSTSSRHASGQDSRGAGYAGMFAHHVCHVACGIGYGERGTWIEPAAPCPRLSFRPRLAQIKSFLQLHLVAGKTVAPPSGWWAINANGSPIWSLLSETEKICLWRMRSETLKASWIHNDHKRMLNCFIAGINTSQKIRLETTNYGRYVWLWSNIL